MKKTKTTNKLAFNKASVTELNDAAMMKINGRHLETETANEPTTYACSNCMTITVPQISLHTIIKQL